MNFGEWSFRRKAARVGILVASLLLFGCIRARSLAMPEVEPRFDGRPLERAVVQSRFPERNVKPGQEFLNLYFVDQAFSEEIRQWGLAKSVHTGEAPDVPVRFEIEVNPRNEDLALGAIGSMLGAMTCYLIPMYSGSIQVDYSIRIQVHDSTIAQYEYAGPPISLWIWVGLVDYEGSRYLRIPNAYSQNARFVARKLYMDLEKDGHLARIADPALAGSGPVGGPVR